MRTEIKYFKIPESVTNPIPSENLEDTITYYAEKQNPGWQILSVVDYNEQGRTGTAKMFKATGIGGI